MNNNITSNEEEERLKINDNEENNFKIYVNQEKNILDNYYYLIKYLLVIFLILAIILFFSELNKLIIIAENKNLRIWKKGRVYLDNCLKELLINKI